MSRQDLRGFVSDAGPILAVWLAGDVALAFWGDDGAAIRFGVAGVLLAVYLWSVRP